MNKTDSKAAERALLKYLQAKGRDVESMKRDAREHQALLQRIQAKFPLHQPWTPTEGSVISAVSIPISCGPPGSLDEIVYSWLKAFSVSIQLDQVTWQVGEIAEIKVILENRTDTSAIYLYCNVYDETGCAEMIAAQGVTSYEVRMSDNTGLKFASTTLDYFPNKARKELYFFAKAIKTGRPSFRISLGGEPDLYHVAWWFAETTAIVPD